ncbi:MAG TPA: GNAT family N-acetyltransferase [Pyrinomonadaceae bacterium]|nr:GNAT family N-acetyltransferase [Pyrinomonadaceae bacterium]
MIWSHGEFSIDDDRSRLDLAVVHSFLTEESYWARDRTFAQTRTAIENSICFGVYRKGKQVGFARVVTDKATFAYLGDVFIVVEYRGRGLGRSLMAAVIEHPELQGLRRWVLATRDAHSLYSRFGFRQLVFPERWMERPAADAY